MKGVVRLFWDAENMRNIALLLVAAWLAPFPAAAAAAAPASSSLQRGWDFVLIEGRFGREDERLFSDDPLCRQLKTYLSKVAPTWTRVKGGDQFNYCSASARSAPFFTEPPWTDLDPHAHQDLIVKLLRFQAEGDRYFDGQPWEFRRDDRVYVENMRHFIEGGGRLQYWKTKLLYKVAVDASGAVADTDIAHVIQLRYKAGTYPEDLAAGRALRKNCTVPDWYGRAFLVNQELTQPLRLSDNHMTSASLLLYAGAPVLISEDWTEVDVNDAGRSNTPHYCRLVYPRNKTRQAKIGGEK
jgi:hypothetical protein